MREKTFLEEIVKYVNSVSKTYIKNAIDILEDLKGIIQGVTQDPLINFLEILDSQSDKRNNFAMTLNILEEHLIRHIDELKEKKKELPIVQYQSKWARYKALRKEYTRQGRKLINQFNKGKINDKEFKEQSSVLFHEGFLYRKQVVRKKTLQTRGIVANTPIFITIKSKPFFRIFGGKREYRTIRELSRILRKRLFNITSEKDNFVDPSARSSDNEKYATQTMKTPTKNNKEDSNHE